MNQYSRDEQTAPRLVAFLTENAGFGFSRVEITEQLGINERSVRRATEKLMHAGQIRCTFGFRKTKLFHVGDLEAEPLTDAPAEPVTAQEKKPAKYVGEIVRPFRADVWTPPLRGYEASLRARAAMAMAGR